VLSLIVINSVVALIFFLLDGNIPSGESIEPCKDTYRGYSAFSEIETRNVRDYLISLGENLKGFIDFQAYGQQWHVPWRHTNAETPDYKEQVRKFNYRTPLTPTSRNLALWRIGVKSGIREENSWEAGEGASIKQTT